jgi:hypothetical protein
MGGLWGWVFHVICGFAMGSRSVYSIHWLCLIWNCSFLRWVKIWFCFCSCLSLLISGWVGEWATFRCSVLIIDGRDWEGSSSLVNDVIWNLKGYMRLLGWNLRKSSGMASSWTVKRQHGARDKAELKCGFWLVLVLENSTDLAQLGQTQQESM